MNKRKIFASMSLLFPFLCWGQMKLSELTEDSLCKYGKKYDEPQRKTIPFPATEVSDAFKLKEIQRAVPDSLKKDTTGKRWFHTYFYETEILDYDPLKDSIFTPDADKVQYKLKDTYFFDINGDGLIDFIHYPAYYMAIMNKEFDTYVIFLQTKNGYQWLTFTGLIVNIKFNKDGTLNKVTTYKGACCQNKQCTFYHYTFNRSTNELKMESAEQLFTCQLKKK